MSHAHRSTATHGPLAGLRVAVTRPAPGAAELARLLADAGAIPLIHPLVRVVTVADAAVLMAALEREYDWAAFTSASAVHAIVQALGTEAHMLRAHRLAAVGSATAAAVQDAWGRVPDVVPAGSTGSDLAAAVLRAAGSLTGARVFWPRAVSARDAFGDAMRTAGALLDDMPVYETVRLTDNARTLATLLEGGGVDVLTFTSPSAVEALADAWSFRGAGDAGDADTGHPLVVAAIGPTTAAAAERAGFSVDVQPEDATMGALVEALTHHVQGRRGSAGR